jgi:hypothetical protein
MEIEISGHKEVCNIFKRIEESIITDIVEKYDIFKIHKNYFDADEFCDEYIGECNVTICFYTDLRKVDKNDITYIVDRYKHEKFFQIGFNHIYEEFIIGKNWIDKNSVEFIYTTWGDKEYNPELEFFSISIDIS